MWSTICWHCNYWQLIASLVEMVTCLMSFHSGYQLDKKIIKWTFLLTLEFLIHFAPTVKNIRWLMFMNLYLWLCSLYVLRNLRICILSLPIISLKNSNHPFQSPMSINIFTGLERTNSFPGQRKSTTFLVWMGPLAIA